MDAEFRELFDLMHQERANVSRAMADLTATVNRQETQERERTLRMTFTTHERIQMAAYYLWQQRIGETAAGDGIPGDALSDWLKAEHQVLG